MLAVSTFSAYIFITPACNQGRSVREPPSRVPRFPFAGEPPHSQKADRLPPYFHWLRFGGAFSLLDSRAPVRAHSSGGKTVSLPMAPTANHGPRRP